MTIEVCYVLNTVSQTNAVATIATALVDSENIEVDILAWFDAEPFDRDNRVDVYCLDAPRSKSGINKKIYDKSRSVLSGYDIIQTHTNHSGSFAKLIGSQLGIPLVSREGNTREGFTRKGRIANGLTNRLADRIVPNSRAVYDSFTRWERILIDDAAVQIIPNGVDLDWIDTACDSNYDIYDEFDIPKHAITVGTASVISEQKAYDTLISGLAAANKRSNSRIDLVIAGDGPKRTEIEAQINDWGIENQVHFAGLVDRNTVYQILGEIDIYAMPSRWEGFANAAVEALGARNPCIFSDIEPFLFPYRNVALFHRLDDADDLTDRIVELAENPDLREFYSKKGRDLVEENYTIEQIAEQYATLYEELI